MRRKSILILILVIAVPNLLSCVETDIGPRSSSASRTPGSGMNEGTTISEHNKGNGRGALVGPRGTTWPDAAQADVDRFVGTWNRTHGSLDGTCFGPLQVNGGVTLTFRASGPTDLELLGICTAPAIVSGDTADASSSTPCSIPDGDTDPITLMPAMNDTEITFVTDSFEYDATKMTLHETVSAIHTSRGSDCTLTGTNVYARASSGI
jgi:hypothetical protein